MYLNIVDSRLIGFSNIKMDGFKEVSEEEYEKGSTLLQSCPFDKYVKVVKTVAGYIFTVIENQKSFDENLAIALSELKSKRETDTNMPINGVDMGTLEDRENIEYTIQYFDTLSGENDYVTWTMEDGTTNNLTNQNLQELVSTYVLRKGLLFATYQSDKVKIESCTTQEDLNSLFIGDGV